MGARRVRLLVCGTGDRGDDAAAISAVAGLLSGLPPQVLSVLEVRRYEQLTLAALLEIPMDSACVIADAVVGLPAGEIVSIPLRDLLAHDSVGPFARSAHEQPIGHLVATAEKIRAAPIPGSFAGIGGRSFGFGRALGRPVRAALPAYRRAIERALIAASECVAPRTA